MTNRDINLMVIWSLKPHSPLRRPPYEYKVMGVEVYVFDRQEASRTISLFDMNAKYTDVISLLEAKVPWVENPAHRSALAETTRALEDCPVRKKVLMGGAFALFQ